MSVPTRGSYAYLLLLALSLLTPSQGATLQLNDLATLQMLAPEAGIGEVTADICRTANLDIITNACITSPTSPSRGSCEHFRCFDPAPMYRALLAAGTPAFYLSTGNHYCASYRTIDAVLDVLGRDLDDILRGSGGTGPGDVRIAKGEARWLPEVNDALACDIPFGAEGQCMRGMCGRRLLAHTVDGVTIPATGPTIECLPLVDDTVLNRFGITTPGSSLPADSLGSRYIYDEINFVFPRVPGDSYLGLLGPTTDYPYLAPLGLATANTYGIFGPASTALATYAGLTPPECGRVDGVGCTWHDPEGLFVTEAEERVCLLQGEQAVHAACHDNKCSGGGVCGVSNNIGQSCPLSGLYLGPGADAYDLGFNGHDGLDSLVDSIDETCLVEMPACVRREIGGAGIPADLADIVAGAMWWAVDVIGPPTVLQTSARTALSSGVSSVVDTSVFSARAPSVCALPSQGGLKGRRETCTPRTVPQYPHFPECVRDGGAYGLCYNMFGGPVSDPDFILNIEPHFDYPGVMAVAQCRYDPMPRGTACEVFSNPQPPNTNLSCVYTACDGNGGCGWYASEEGTLCAEPTESVAEGCLFGTCTREGVCAHSYLPEGTPCSDGNPNTERDTCTAQGSCIGREAIVGPGEYRRCVTDHDCQCTGVGAVVGWCDTEVGLCVEKALRNPYAMPLNPLTPIPPLQPWEAEEQWDRDDETATGQLPSLLRRCTVTPHRPLHAGASSEYIGGEECLLEGRGICYEDGSCGAPLPALKWAYLPPVPTSPNVTCTTANCELVPAHTEWYHQEGAICARATVCSVGMGAGGDHRCTAPDLLTGLVSCEPPAAAAGAPVAPAGTPCNYTDFWEQGGADRCALSYACTGTGYCAVDTRIECTLQDGIGIGPCFTAPACDKNTGTCTNAARPYGTPCPDICSVTGTFGRCDSSGGCIHQAASRNPSQGAVCEVGTCNVGACQRVARMDDPPNLPLHATPLLPLKATISGTPAPSIVKSISPHSPFDVGPSEVGLCKQVPTELALGGGGTLSCDDGSLVANDACVDAATCSGSGICTPSSNVECPPHTTCLPSSGCSSLTGRCLAIAEPTTTACVDSGEDGACKLVGMCDGKGECLAPSIVCPDAPVGTCGGITSACYIATGGKRNGVAPPGSPYPIVFVPPFGIIYSVPSENDISAALLNAAPGRVVAVWPAAVPLFADDNGVCVYRTEGDGAACPLPDVCSATAACLDGVCTSTRTLECLTGTTDEGDCYENVGTCSIADGGCVYAPKAQGESCVSNNPCLTNLQCNGLGACVGTQTGCAASADECQINVGVCPSCNEFEAVPDFPVTPCSCTTNRAGVKECFRMCKGGICVAVPSPTEVCDPECVLPRLCVDNVCACPFNLEGPLCDLVIASDLGYTLLGYASSGLAQVMLLALASTIVALAVLVALNACCTLCGIMPDEAGDERGGMSRAVVVVDGEMR